MEEIRKIIGEGKNKVVLVDTPIKQSKLKEIIDQEFPNIQEEVEVCADELGEISLLIFK